MNAPLGFPAPCDRCSKVRRLAPYGEREQLCGACHPLVEAVHVLRPVEAERRAA